MFGSPGVVAELARRVADVDAVEYGGTALWEAVLTGRTDNARALVEAGADPWLPLIGGWSPGRLALAGPAPELAPLPEGEPGLTDAERAAAEEGRRLLHLDVYVYVDVDGPFNPYAAKPERRPEGCTGWCGPPHGARRRTRHLARPRAAGAARGGGGPRWARRGPDGAFWKPGIWWRVPRDDPPFGSTTNAAPGNGRSWPYATRVRHRCGTSVPGSGCGTTTSRPSGTSRGVCGRMTGQRQLRRSHRPR